MSKKNTEEFKKKETKKSKLLKIKNLNKSLEKSIEMTKTQSKEI